MFLLEAFFGAKDDRLNGFLSLSIEEDILLLMPPCKRNQHVPQASNRPQIHAGAQRRDPRDLPAFSLTAAFGLAAAMILASPAAAKDAAPPKAWKSAIAAHLHSAPASQAPVIASIPVNAVLTSTQPCAKGWCLVQYKGARGWIYRNFIAETPVNAAPAAAAPAAPMVKAPMHKPAAAPQPAAAAPPVRLPAPQTGASATYRVIGLQPGESLPVREGPVDNEPMVGSLPSSASGITDLKTCVRQWCLVGHDGIKGYAQSRFLGRERQGPATRYSIAGDGNVKVFSFRSANADVVGEIPFFASGIVSVGDCNADWCHIRYLGLVGFVETRSLRQAPAPEG